MCSQVLQTAWEKVWAYHHDRAKKSEPFDLFYYLVLATTANTKLQLYTYTFDTCFHTGFDLFSTTPPLQVFLHMLLFCFKPQYVCTVNMYYLGNTTVSEIAFTLK